MTYGTGSCFHHMLTCWLWRVVVCVGFRTRSCRMKWAQVWSRWPTSHMGPVVRRCSPDRLVIQSPRERAGRLVLVFVLGLGCVAGAEERWKRYVALLWWEPAAPSTLPEQKRGSGPGRSAAVSVPDWEPVRKPTFLPSKVFNVWNFKKL